MKVLTLNLWGGRLNDTLLDFLAERTDIDIFCFQEVYRNADGLELVYTNVNLDLYNDLVVVLPGYHSFFESLIEDYWGLALFVKKGTDFEVPICSVIYNADEYTLEEQAFGHSPKKVQSAAVYRADGTIVHVCNVHGLWNGNGKEDCTERLIQSMLLIKHIERLPGLILLCGDFNLSPGTQSLAKIEARLGLTNLITVHGVTSTRTAYYEKANRFADYILHSPALLVAEFKVLPDVVSDHAALYVEIV